MSNQRSDLAELLQEQIGFLERSCASFDEGYIDEAKRIAVIVRVLLHDTASSHSLFRQLGYKDYMLIDTCPSLEGEIPGKIFQAGLAIPSLKGYIPRHEVSSTVNPVWLGFDNWWNNPVIKTQDRTYSRRELVLILANKEGGAHVNPTLTAHYEKLKHEGSGIFLSQNGKKPEPMTKQEHTCLRQIAFELIESLVAIQSGEAPVDDHDDRPTAFNFPVYLFIKAKDTTPIQEVKVATIQALNDLLPVFDNESAAEEAKKMLQGDYVLKHFGKDGFVNLLRMVALPNHIEYLTLNPDLNNEGYRMIHRYSVTSAISSLESEYTDEEIERKLSEGTIKRA